MFALHYCLHVKRLENLQWKSRLHSDIPDLYVELKLGSDVKQTQTIKKTNSPVWNEELTFYPSNDARTLNIRVLHASKWSRDPCVGEVDIPIVDLLAASASDEARLRLLSSSERRSGTIILHLRQIDSITAAHIEINNAEDDVERSEIRHSAQASGIMDVINDRVTRQGGEDGLYKPIGQLLERLDTLTKVINVLSEIHPFLALAWKVTSGLLKTVKHVFDTDKKLIRLVWIMKDAYDFSYETLSLPDKAARLEKAISGLLKQTIECCLFIRQYTKGNFVGRMLDTSSSDKIDEFEKSLAWYKSTIELGVNLYTAFASVRILDGIDEMLLRQRLEPSLTDTSNRSRSVCLEGTRTEILMEISDWIFSENEKNIFWLYGVAGSGKSTISMTIAERFRDMLVLGGSLMFERGKSDPSSVIRTIAYKLALHDSSIASEIVTVMKEDKDIIAAIPATQFEKLLLRPLAAVEDSLPGPVAFVLDALDECGTPESRRDLLQLFRHKFPKLPQKFRFLITSRPEKDIDYALAFQNEAVRVVELDYTSTSSQEDVLSYLRTEIETIVTEQVGPEAAEDWDWEKSAVVLGKAAGGLFIFASTAVKMISISDNPFDTLEGLISNASSVAHFGLNELYASALQHSGIAWDNSKSRSRFANVLALVLLGKRPLTSEMIDGILGYSSRERSLLVLSRLRCLLSYSPGAHVYLLHTSFYDYLTFPGRAEDPWYIDISAQQQFITARCFGVMQDMLHFNICSLESSFVRNEEIPGLADRVQRSIPEHLEYVCLYWSSHLCDSQQSSDLIDKLLEFGYERLLFWFEALSLSAVFGHFASPALADAAGWAESWSADLSSFLKDASRLAFVFSLPITQSTPHIYMSMIPLTRDESIVSSHYSKRMSNLVHIARYGARCPLTCLKVLEGHSQTLCSVDVSPDGKRIASASFDRTVRMWDIGNGEELLTLAFGCAVWSVKFSPDGSQLAMGCDDSAIRICDVLEGKLLFGPVKRHTNRVNSIAYSPDGKRIVSGSHDGTVIVWDALSGLGLAVLGHSGRVLSVGFSADGSLVASGSQEKTLRIWDVKTGELVLEPFVHPFDVLSVAFCGSSRYIASCCGDRNVRIWDTENGILVSVFFCETMGHNFCVACSPCGTRIVSGSRNGTVKVWDANSGHVISILRGHSGSVWSVGFTPDGKYVVSGSDDRTVRVWDAATRHVDQEEAVHHTSRVTSVAYSPCGSRIASASNDMTIIVWNARTGEAVMGPLRGHTAAVNSVIFSPDGSRLVSGSSDKSVRIWHAESGNPVGEPLEGHTKPVTCVALSPDGVRIASGSNDTTIMVWDMAQCKLAAGPLGGHKGAVNSVVFSSDGTRLASGSSDGTIRIWDTKTWEPISEPLRGHKGRVRCVSFSPDNTRIASGSIDETIIVWDTETGEIIASSLKGNYDWANSVIFLPDRSHLVAGYGDGAIRLFGIAAGQMQTVGDPLRGHSERVTSLALSPDGSRIASGSDDKTVRVWDVSTVTLRLAQQRSESSTARARARARARSVSVSPSASSSDGDLLDWTMVEDGWVLGGPGYRNRLLCWIPPDLRRMLWSPQNTAVCWEVSTKLDFTAADAAALGRRWTECFTAQS